MRRLLSCLSMAFLTTYGLNACRTAKQDSTGSADLDPRNSSSTLLMGVNDVSFYLSPRQDLRFSTTTGESVLFPQDMFQETLKLADGDKAKEMERIKFEKYEDWLIAAARIDTCARILPNAPCETQLRLVAQAAERTGIFRDQAIHLAFRIDEAKRLEMLQDFVDYKKSRIEGSNRVELPSLIRKYALVANLERVAVMLTVGQTWTFGASQTIVDQKIVASPIPCIGTTTLSLLASDVVIARGQESKLSPESKCQDLNAQRLLTEDMPHGQWFRLSKEEKDKEIQTALRINDPSKVFFASTDCVSCHVAGRALFRVKGGQFLVDDPSDPNRYVRPSDMQGEGNVSTADHINAWGTRAFGYGQNGQSKAMSLYTFNDSLRVAHEINELIRAGTLH